MIDSNQSDFNYRAYNQNQPRHEKKSMSVIAIIAICSALSLIFGCVGGVAVSYFQKPVTNGSEVVIYRDITLREKDKNALDKTLTVGEIADNCKKSVVEITTEAVSTGSFMMQYVTEGAGSGVIISDDGYIVTNNHVIEGATSVSVRTSDGNSLDARVIGTDPKTDLAVIKVDGKFTPAVLGSFEDCQVGDTVVAIGNPLGTLGGTVTDGIISALDREITIDNNIMTLVQTNTAINPGNSGGGLFDTDGTLIGVVNAKSSGEDVEGLGFAIPISIAQPIISDLIEHGYVTGRIATGMEVLEISDFQSAMYYRVSVAGLYVYSIEQGSAADSIGIRAGDLIKSVNGVSVTTSDEYNKLLKDAKVGDVVELVLSRKGTEYTASLTLQEQKG